MRRFNFGATNRPALKRPGSPFGQLTYGAPGPCKEVEPREEIVPEMFLENSEKPKVRTTYVADFNIPSRRVEAETTIDLRLE